MAVTEETYFDERVDRIMNLSLAWSRAPVIANVPRIGITGAAAALANDIVHATGKRIRSFPITLNRLL